MTVFFLTHTWGEFVGEIIKSPQSYVIWLVVFLIVLFMLSRLRNIMEERGVNRAIYVSRAFVGTFISFIVAPIVFYIMLNLVALVHGVSTIDIGFLAKWLGLTVTSYWWLLKCFFGAADIVNAKDLYSLDAIIRILWIILPFSFIWLRVSSTRIGKLFLIPLVIGTLVITRYKYAPPTFITQDENLVERIPGLNWMKSKENNFSTPGTYIFSPNQRRLAAGILSLFIIAGFGVGLYAKRRVPGLLLVLIGLMGFILLAPHESNKKVAEEHHEDYHNNIDSLVTSMDSVYAINPESIEAYYLSQKITAYYKARIAVGDMISFPDELCERYNSYFYDWCKD
ncbi:MAG: hypothetical protein ACRBFS_03130 [Aureispira sp.]